jgi:hypothetical protein
MMNLPFATAWNELIFSWRPHTSISDIGDVPAKHPIVVTPESINGL